LCIRSSAGGAGDFDRRESEPDKVCNFDCIYCQVDRTTTSETRFVAIDQLLQGTEETLRLAASGRLFEHEVQSDSARIAAIERHCFLRRRQTDDVSQFSMKSSRPVLTSSARLELDTVRWC
jgi:uncharacterized Fe-S cluster-containing radical SAM superfamily enzyme